MTGDPRVICYQCDTPMSAPLTYVSIVTRRNMALALATPTPTQNSVTITEGYAKAELIYLVMDNLEVHSMSTISTVTLLKDLNVKDVSILIEKEVEVGLTEVFSILNHE